MSFSGIRRIRENRRQSPMLLESAQLSSPRKPRPVALNLDLTSSQLCKDIRSTGDSEMKGESPLLMNRRTFVAHHHSKEKEKKLMVGNFLHINLDQIPSTQGRHSAHPRRITPNQPRTPTPTRLDSRRIIKERTHSTKGTQQKADHTQKTPVAVGVTNFNFEFVVGKGGFGKVWKVREKGTGKIYAMKEMRKVKIVSKRSVQSVLNEKELLSRLRHPFLVNMAYSFQNRQNLYLVMDYCNRGDLRYHLGNRRKFKEDETRFFLACIIVSLEYLHSHKVIHRDLKPQNLVFDERGYVRLTDLGVSRQVKAHNAEDTSGTPGYMAPEVITKQNHSYPVDFFALGVMGYEFMTGRRPYTGANRKEIREKILAKQVKLDEIPPYGWSPSSVSLINALIQRKPSDRLGTGRIEEIKSHPFFKKIDWAKLAERRLIAPFMPETVEEDYHNYRECISEDTQIEDMEEYKMMLRHRDTQEAFIGYDSKVAPTPQSQRKKVDSRDFDHFMHTTMALRKRK